MLRPFSLVSQDIEYDLGGFANFRFPETPKGSARCAITGIRYVVRSDDPAVLLIDGYGTLLERLTVAGRNYVQGQIPMPLIAAATVTGGVPFGFPYVNRFPGNQIGLGDNSLGVPWLGSAIAFGPSDEVRMRLFGLNPTIRVTQVILDCVQWPDDMNDPSLEIWKALRYKGHGEPYFIGSRLEGWRAPGTTEQLEELPQPPSAVVLNRTGFRALVMDNTGNVSNFEVGDIGSPTMNNLSAQAYTSFQRPPQNRFIPLRTLAGLTGMEIATGFVGMEQDSRSIIEIQYTGTALPDNVTDVYVMHMFEGRDQNVPALNAANAVS